MPEKIEAQEAGYMELSGAKKDADCSHVEVKDGVSKERGCCNDFEPNEGANSFKCGNCEYVILHSKDNFFG